jgi:hypothetical protein
MHHPTVIVCHGIIVKIVMGVLRSTWICSTSWLMYVLPVALRLAILWSTGRQSLKRGNASESTDEKLGKENVPVFMTDPGVLWCMIIWLEWNGRNRVSGKVIGLLQWVTGHLYAASLTVGSVRSGQSHWHV